MSSHSASKGSEPGDRATSNVAESAPIAGQEFAQPRSTHASGLRERVQPSESEPPTPVDSGEGFMRRLAAPGGDEWQAAIELAKRKLAQSGPSTPATHPSEPVIPPADAQSGSLPSAGDELQAAIEAAKQRLSAASSLRPLSALSEREPSRFPPSHSVPSRASVEPEASAEAGEPAKFEPERNDASTVQPGPLPPGEEEEAASEDDWRAVIEQARRRHSLEETEDQPSMSLAPTPPRSTPPAGDQQSSEALDAPAAVPPALELEAGSSQPGVPEGEGRAPVDDHVASAVSPATLPASPIPEPEPVSPAPRRRWGLRLLLWTLVLAVVFVLGAAFGQTQRGIRWTRTVRALVAKNVNTGEPKVVPSQSRPAPKARPQKPGVKADPIPLLEQKSPDQRTLTEAVALGHYWLQQPTKQFEALAKELKLKPDLLTDDATRQKLAGFIDDRTTSVQALELLARMATPAALDILYEVWIGSKGRTDTTRLAEALVLASDVRPHAGPALNLALALRDKPTNCEQVRKLVDTALQLGDRRSAMLLVRTAARKDCTNGSSKIQCKLCLDDTKKMREAIRTAAGRPGPTLYGSASSDTAATSGEK